jgi:hypothetical protein
MLKTDAVLNIVTSNVGCLYHLFSEMKLHYLEWCHVTPYKEGSWNDSNGSEVMLDL